MHNYNSQIFTKASHIHYKKKMTRMKENAITNNLFEQKSLAKTPTLFVEFFLKDNCAIYKIYI